MSRIDRLKALEQGRFDAPNGAASSKQNLDAWSKMASANSKIAPRARNGKMKLPSTGKTMSMRDTSMAPKAARNIDREIERKMAGKDDPNHVGSSFMKEVRRKA